MPSPKQPEKGIKASYNARYKLTIGPCTGLDRSEDVSSIADSALVDAINARVQDGIVVARGGQSGPTTSTMNGCIQGLIDIPGSGVRGITAHDDGNLGGTGDPAYVGMFDENLRANPVDATNFSTIDGDPFEEHPVEADPGGDTWSDNFARYAYTWWDGQIIFQDKDSKKLYKFILPESGSDPADLTVEELFDLVVPGEGTAFDIASFALMPQIGNVRGAEPLYFGTMAGGIVAYSQGQMIRILADSTFTGRVTLFVYNNRLYAAGRNKVMYQSNGWTSGGSGTGSAFTDIAIPATPVEFVPMAGIEGLGFGWIAGWDDSHASGAPGSFGNETGYLLKVNDSGGGTPVITVGFNGSIGGDTIWSIDDLTIGPQGVIYAAWRSGGPASFFAQFGTWNGTTFSSVRSWLEAEAMCYRIVGTAGKVYGSGWGSDSATEIVAWDGSGITEIVQWGFSGDKSPWDMAIF